MVVEWLKEPESDFNILPLLLGGFMGKVHPHGEKSGSM